jgi:hypothetical protein
MAVLLFLTLFFGYNWQSHILAFYFSSLLLPVVIGTTYFFNLYLVPRYLLTGRYGLFALYFFYMLVVSLYLETLVSLLSLVILANYDVEVMGVQSMSILILGINLYLIVFATSFIRLVIQFRNKSQHIHFLETEIQKKEKPAFVIRADRKNHHIPPDDLLYIESLNDYVKVVTTGPALTAREKITRLHERLPAQFIRVHRSFVINKEKVESYTKTEVLMQGGTAIPIGRTYKQSAIEELEAAALKTD